MHSKTTCHAVCTSLEMCLFLHLVDAAKIYAWRDALFTVHAVVCMKPLGCIVEA